MTKTFCDRCGKEASDARQIELSDLSNGRPIVKIDACGRCYTAIVQEFQPMPLALPAAERESVRGLA